MLISKINSILSGNYSNNIDVNNNRVQSQEKSNPVNNCLKMSEIPSEKLKANFLPSFGRYKKVGDVELVDRKTGNNVKAALKREKIGDYVMYKIFKGKEEEGFLDLTNVLFPEGDYVIAEPDNNIPKILHLCSLKGDKYSGIGTALVSAAVDESIKMGKGGCLWAVTEKGYAKGLTDYRKNENPIPFYYKLGFKTVSPKLDEDIKRCIETKKYNQLPYSSVILLTSQAARENFPEKYHKLW